MSIPIGRVYIVCGGQTIEPLKSFHLINIFRHIGTELKMLQ